MGGGTKQPQTARRAAGCSSLRLLGYVFSAVLGFELCSLRSAFGRRCADTVPRSETRRSSPALPIPVYVEAPTFQQQTWSAPSWSVAGEHRKRGAGMLFFACEPAAGPHCTLRSTKTARDARRHAYRAQMVAATR